MKTAKQYIIDIMGYEPTTQRIDYADALAAVQAALDDAGTVGQQLRQVLREYFGEPDEIYPTLPPALPRDETPRIRLGSCTTCGEARRECLRRECPNGLTAYRTHFGEEPPF